MKINKSKIYGLIGRAVVGITAYAMVEATVIKSMIYVVNNCITTIR